MNEGETASRLGLAGIPREAETVLLERDLRLVRLTGARYHAAMISCADSVALMRQAKEAGLPVTCGVSINSLTLNENDIGDYRTFLKLSPPLRSEDDRQAVIDGLADGVIDVIVSDHNPQDVETKRLPFAESADGAIGLETLLSAALRLVHDGRLSLRPAHRRAVGAAGGNPAAVRRAACGRRAGRSRAVRPRRALCARQARSALALEELALRRSAPPRPRPPDLGGRANCV